MFIAKNLKQLRLSKGMTQEEIAERIGVSGQAVSKWERDECYPDITLLPGLANLFDVSVDDLIGMSEINEKGKQWKIHAQVNILQVQGKYHEAVEILEKAIKTFPSDISFLTTRATTLVMAGEKAEQAIEICERALTEKINEKYKATVTAVLCYLYSNIGLTDKAVKLARSRPHARESRELLLPNFLTQPERDEYLRENLPLIITDICMLIENNTKSLEEQLRLIKLGTYDNVVKADEAVKIIGEFLNKCE